jgi:hypothetical protein
MGKQLPCQSTEKAIVFNLLKRQEGAGSEGEKSGQGIQGVGNVYIVKRAFPEAFCCTGSGSVQQKAGRELIPWYRS